MSRPFTPAPAPPGWGSTRLLGRWREPTTIRGAIWTARSLRQVHRSLAQHGLGAEVSPPPPLPWRASRGVLSVLARQPNSCLERALVLQAWLLAHGHRHEVVVGVNDSVTEFAAHAWMDFEDGSRLSHGFDELTRLAPSN